MKKKIVNLMLLAATMLVASGAFVSCKDYCEDDINDLKGQLADQNTKLTNLINTQKTELQNQLKTLEDAQAACRQNCDAIKTSLDEYLKKLEAQGLYLTKTDAANTYQTKEDGLSKTDAANTYQTKEDGLSKTDAANTYLTKADGLSKEEAAAAYVTLERYNNEYLNYVAADALLQQAIDAIKARDNQQSDSLKTLAEQFLEFNSKAIEASATVQEALTRIQKAQALAESDSVLINELNNSFTTLNNSFTTLNSSFTTLQTTVNNLKIISWTDNEFLTVKAAAESAQATATANQVIVNVLRDSMNTVNQALQQLDSNFIEKVNKQGEDITSLITQVNETKQLVETYNTNAIATIEAATATIGEVKQALNQAQSSMGGDLDRLTSKIDNLQKQLVNYIDDMFSHLITGIIIQGTYNTVFGEGAIPIGARTQMLATFFGEAPSQGIEFPTVRGRYYVDQEAIELTEEDLERIGITDIYTAEEGEILMDDAEDNAGTLYFTVNPTSASLAGSTFELVNSRDESAVVDFTPAYLSDHLLSFGWTRAANNGFYETSVKINPENVKSFVPTLYLNADSSYIVQKIKDVRKNFNRKTAADLAASVFDLSGEILPAYGMKTTWYDVNGAHSVISSYSLGIAAITPLSYAFLNDADYKTAPGYEKVIDKINGIKSLQKPSRQDARQDIISYVDKLNNFICQTVNDFNDFLQPTLLAESDNVIFRVMASGDGSVVKGSSVLLHPTSYTGEFLAPAFKKFVAVSNIYKNGDSIGDEAVRAFNAANNLQQVLPGRATSVKLEGLQSGCVYEIVYSAVDYTGRVVANKYYINVQ